MSSTPDNDQSPKEPEGSPQAGKVDILLKATGDAPILKKRKWQVEGEKDVGFVINFVKQFLKLEKHENLFFYVSQAFAPAPDHKIRDLYLCYGSDNKLVLYYSRTPAWG